MTFHLDGSLCSASALKPQWSRNVRPIWAEM
jgi:hypothetical protein